MAAKVSSFSRSVFLNVPFDDDYEPLLNAMAFAVADCGFYPRCAKEQEDSGQPRIEKILRLVEEARFGIHDISRVELDASNQLPRFNMPFELGLFMGAKRWGRDRQGQKALLILDVEQYRYQKYLSDIAGQDIRAHGGDQARLITAVRNWLASKAPNMATPSGSVIAGHFRKFEADLPEYCREVRLIVDELTFNDRCGLMVEWIGENEGEAVVERSMVTRRRRGGGPRARRGR